MLIRGRRYRAGASALEVWRLRRRETIRRQWRVWAALGLAVIGLAVGLPFARGVGQLFMAVALGSLATMTYVAWEIGGDVHSLTWRWGQWGEEETEDALRPLELDGWRVIHDIPCQRGNWDHIVVGPGGVFLLETKNYRAAAVVSDDRVRFGRTTSFKGRDFAREAKSLYWLLHARERSFVWPVVVIWGEFAQGEVEDNGVFYIAGSSLAPWLSTFDRLPQQLSSSKVEELATAIERLRQRKL